MKTTLIVIIAGLFSLNSYADIAVQIRGVRSIRKELTESLSRHNVKVVDEDTQADFGIEITKYKQTFYGSKCPPRLDDRKSHFEKAKPTTCVKKFYNAAFKRNGKYLTRREEFKVGDHTEINARARINISSRTNKGVEEFAIQISEFLKKR